MTLTGTIGEGQTLILTGGTTIANIETLSLSLGAGNDTIVLDGGNFGIVTGDGRNSVTTGAGNDSVSGGSGDDTISAGAGNDSIFGFGGNDRLSGGAGDDSIQAVGSGNVVLDGGEGNDFLVSGWGLDTLIGGAGADIFQFFGQGGIDRVLDFTYAAGDRVDAAFFRFDPETEGFPPEAVARATVTDPIGEGYVRVTQTAEGVLVGLVANAGSGLLLTGVTLADLPPDFLI